MEVGMQKDGMEAPSDEELQGIGPEPEEDAGEADDAAEDASLEEIIAKKSDEDAGDDANSEEESVLTLEPEDRVAGALPSNVQPLQSSEFTCRSCFLVKSKSQLADRKRMLCRDCADRASR